MVELFGKHYYIDFDGITDKCRINKKKTRKTSVESEDADSIEVNIFKYEIIKMCLDRVLNEFEEVDEEMGVFAQNDTAMSFKLAFNSLIKSDIIKEDE
jgi:SHS2 domain-containing protein